MSAAISLRNVVKTYKRGKESVPVLHGLSLEIPAGQFVSLMGPSGSGKTTILNLVGGLDHANSGWRNGAGGQNGGGSGFHSDGGSRGGDRGGDRSNNAPSGGPSGRFGHPGTSNNPL